MNVLNCRSTWKDILPAALRSHTWFTFYSHALTHISDRHITMSLTPWSYITAVPTVIIRYLSTTLPHPHYVLMYLSVSICCVKRICTWGAHTADAFPFLERCFGSNLWSTCHIMLITVNFLPYFHICNGTCMNWNYSFTCTHRLKVDSNINRIAAFCMVLTI